MVVLLTMLAGVAACSGSSGGDSGQTAEQRLAAAKKSVDDATYIGFTVTSDNLPGGVSALQSAQGVGTHAPAFTGKVQVIKGLSFSAALIAVDGKVYAELPFVGWTTIDPASYGAPDPAALMDRSTGLSSLLTDTVDPQIDGSERSGSTVYTKISGTLPGKAVRAFFASAADSDFKVEYLVTSANDLHSVAMTGPFYGDHGDSTYTIVLNLSAAPVTVTPPS